MRIMVNGRWQDKSDAISVAELLDELAMEPLRVAIELNGQIVPRANYAQTRLAENDQLEIVTFVGGG